MRCRSKMRGRGKMRDRGKMRGIGRTRGSRTRRWWRSRGMIRRSVLHGRRPTLGRVLRRSLFGYRNLGIRLGLSRLACFFGRIGLQQSIERQLAVFLLIADAVLIRAEFTFRQTFQQRHVLAAIQTLHDVVDRPFPPNAKDQSLRFLYGKVLMEPFWGFPPVRS